MTAKPCLELLLVEDEALIAMMAEDMIEGLGHRLVASCASLTEAAGAIATLRFDAALLDVNLNGESSMVLATQLKGLGRPFAFTTGYGPTGIDAEHRDVPVLAKPYALSDFEALIERIAKSTV